MKKTLLLTCVIILIASGCGQSPVQSPSQVPPQNTVMEPTKVPTDTKLPPTETLEPTQTEIPPTNTPEPTETPLPPTQTPLPEGILFRDDFDGSFQPGWQWMNENPDKWGFVDFGGFSWLRIIGDKAGNFEDQTNTLMRDLPEGDFVITTHVLANPNQNFHQANIFIFEDAQNYIRLNFGFCDRCGLPEGYGYFMETIIENNPFGDFYAVPRGAEDTDIYLRLVNQDGSITGYYTTELGEWQRIGAFGNYFDFVSVGLGATDSVPPSWEVEDIEAFFEYFEISTP
jgi:regulation of enolase protein 1 (concanavalin A-like superfamily)